MNKSELKQMIKETIESVQAEAAKKASPSGPTYTFDQLNKLLNAKKIVVFIQSEYDGEFIEIDEEDGFYMQENADGEKTVHASSGGYEYEYGVEFDQVYVAQRVNIK
jgi:hypothetical protein